MNQNPLFKAIRVLGKQLLRREIPANRACRDLRAGMFLGQHCL